MWQQDFHDVCIAKCCKLVIKWRNSIFICVQKNRRVQINNLGNQIFIPCVNCVEYCSSSLHILVMYYVRTQL
ncbi:hypothetical protein MT325_m453R [Paramecium bursaria chlorella virus MT325]|uniref:Uncharacterized protein m453R n=1 Tax=Paramecium bursaria Chlorella virus MT325 TaxID=346932 RepID=A7IUI3_PBCVM|nr:hypothetical protein MT325_m453R [Paramecium bursaria chlorella virus MT325]